ncbi:hypothetical protein J6590_031779 [Homalodisca vitripennis]|nr:hypothetical protein J6590_031779 [Homalodisca vitripennis]
MPLPTLDGSLEADCSALAESPASDYFKGYNLNKIECAKEVTHQEKLSSLSTTARGARGALGPGAQYHRDGDKDHTSTRDAAPLGRAMRTQGGSTVIIRLDTTWRGCVLRRCIAEGIHGQYICDMVSDRWLVNSEFSFSETTPSSNIYSDYLFSSNGINVTTSENSSSNSHKQPKCEILTLPSEKTRLHD